MSCFWLLLMQIEEGGDTFLILIIFKLRMVVNIKQFSVPQIEYPLGGSSKRGSHVYFLLIVAMVLLL